MIKSLHIKNYLLIPEIHIDFKPGLTTITGETGAGKSLVIDSIDLALGSRATSDIIRVGSNKAEIFLVFEISRPDISSMLKSMELDDGDDECILHRVIFRDQPSRAFVNSRPVTLQTVRTLASMLIEIHGQNEHQLLLRSPTQRAVLDSYSGIFEQSTKLDQLASGIRAEISRRDKLIDRKQDLQEQLDLIQHQQSTLVQLRPEENEFSRLKEELTKMTHAAELAQTLDTVIHKLVHADQTNVRDNLAICIDSINHISQFDETLKSFAELLEESQIRVEEVSRDLQISIGRTDYEPQELDAIERRMTDLQQQARIHNCDADKLPSMMMDLANTAKNIQDEISSIDSIDHSIDQQMATYNSLADRISESRNSNAAKLASDISKTMQCLGMKGGQFSIALNKLDANEITGVGRENVIFNVAVNPGQPAGPISQVASGGELSRLSLAIQAVATNLSQVPTIIFDEVDVGIGGKVAEQVGFLLKQLGQSVQILCITHLPQVASKGDNQLNVVKLTDDFSSVEIHELSEDQRILEIARMLGGAKITALSTEHAKEMLSQSLN